MDRGDLADDEVEAGKQALPPLVKGYLRLGGFVGDGAVVDPQFGTTDVSIAAPAIKVIFFMSLSSSEWCWVTPLTRRRV